VRRVLLYAALAVWAAGVILVVVGDRGLGFSLAGIAGLVLFALLVSRLDDPGSQPGHTPPF
jgi:hypothetical protein